MLAGVQMSECRAQLGAICRGDKRRQIAHRIAAGRFDLDHFHAQVGKHAAAQLAAQTGQIQRSKTFEKFSAHLVSFN